MSLHVTPSPFFGDATCQLDRPQTRLGSRRDFPHRLAPTPSPFSHRLVVLIIAETKPVENALVMPRRATTSPSIALAFSGLLHLHLAAALP